jgi:hypothetical protein
MKLATNILYELHFFSTNVQLATDTQYNFFIGQLQFTIFNTSYTFLEKYATANYFYI